MLDVVLVRANGSKAVPLKSTADAFPKPGRLSEPVSISVWLAETKLDDA